jgi:hypothetical protein
LYKISPTKPLKAALKKLTAFSGGLASRFTAFLINIVDFFLAP